MTSRVARAVLERLKVPRLRFPTQLTIEPLQVCNAKCFSCPYTHLSEDREYTRQRMSREQIARVLADFAENLGRYDFRGRALVTPYRFSDPLVCPDLDLILAKAAEHGFLVQITTNGVSFGAKKVKLLEAYDEQVQKHVCISILGSTADEVDEFMKVDLDRTLATLRRIAETSPRLRSKLQVSLRRIKDTPEEAANLEGLRKEFLGLGFDVEIKPVGWIQNRIEGEPWEQTPGHFIQGCGLYRNKILRRLEVMVNGDVVLCCNDAEARRVFGNVFEQSIDEIWNGPLLEEHRKIYAQTFSEGKNDLICVRCSQAEYGTLGRSPIKGVPVIGVREMARHALKGALSSV
jgi:MoaA/NifB/PqqE/SkfB family radical SAM enzyme